MRAGDAERDDAYRAVGRYVVGFSRLIFQMRMHLELHASDEGRSDPIVAALLLGRASAAEISRAYFAACREVTEFDDEEDKIAKKLEARVRRELQRRNRFAHGDWWIGFGGKEDGSGADPPTLGQPGAGGSMTKMQEIPPAEMDEYSDRLYALRQQVAELGAICFGVWPLQHRLARQVRVNDVFTLKDDEILRNGPVAQGIPGRIEFS